MTGDTQISCVFNSGAHRACYFFVNTALVQNVCLLIRHISLTKLTVNICILLFNLSQTALSLCLIFIVLA